jgi:hypothetical protein
VEQEVKEVALFVMHVIEHTISQAEAKEQTSLTELENMSKTETRCC